MPGTDGLTLAREVRAQSRIPVIMLTARVAPVDHIIGLENGADDYMGKPFEPRELVARIQAVLRRTQEAGEVDMRDITHGVLHFDGWALHCSERTLVSSEGLVVALSNAEFRLLKAFLQTPGKLLRRDVLTVLAQGKTRDSTSRSIDLLVSRLRQKLGQTPLSCAPIQTVRGAGYLFNVGPVRQRTAWRV